MSPAYRLVSRSFGLRILERQAIVVQNELAQRPRKVISSDKTRKTTDSDYPEVSRSDSVDDSISFSSITSSME